MANEMPIIENWDRGKAREILDSMSGHRINLTRIKFEETGSLAKGGQGALVVGALNIPGAFAGLSEMKVVIKKFGWDHEDVEESTRFFKSFVNELSLMATFNHPNVIGLIGFVEDMQKGDAWLIIPWEANGNVRDFLASGEWDIPERVSLIQDTVNGLEYLHTREPPICHGDIKSHNILVSASYHAVITDFGSARRKHGLRTAETDHLVVWTIDDIVQEPMSPKIQFNPSTLELTLTGPGFSLRWTAPEVLNNGIQDLPSDMWSIGWICWEIFTGRLPFEGLNVQTAIMAHIIKGRLPAIREEGDLSHVLQLCSLMMDCWMPNPTERIDVFAFRRKVSFVPSITPSGNSSRGSKVRSAALLLELGRLYGLQNNTMMAESHYRSAIDVASQTKDEEAKANALIGLGEVYSDQSRYREAVKAFMEAYEIHCRCQCDNGAADALNGLGEVYNDQSRYREAEKAFMEAHELHSRMGNERGVGNALIGLGKVYSARSRESEAKKAFSEAHEIHSRIGNDNGAADALNGLGEVYSRQSRYREAEKAFTEAREMHCRIGNDNGAADASNGLGEVYSDQSRYREAEKAFMEAYEIHSRIGNERGVGNTLIGLGKFYAAQSIESEAKKAFSEAHEIHSRIGNKRGAADALNGLGDVYSGQSRDPKAKETIAITWEINSHIGDDCEVADARAGLGEIYNAQSGYSEDEGIFMKTREIRSHIPNERGDRNALMGLGKVYSAESGDSGAETAFSKAHDLHSHIGNERGVGDALISLGKVYSAQSRYSEAEKAFREAREIHSRIGNDFGVGNALIGLGGIYDAQFRDLEAEKAYIEAHKIHSRVGKSTEAATALIALGNNYWAQSRDSEAKQAHKDAQEILSRIGRESRAINVPKDPEDTDDDDDELWDSEDEEALKEASRIRSRTLTKPRIGNEQGDEEQTREIPPTEPRNLYEMRTTPISGFDDGTSASVSRQNPDQSVDSESGSLPVPSTPVYKATEASLPEPSSPPCSPQTFATSYESPYLLQPPRSRMHQASASSQLTSVADPAFHDDQQERLLTEQLATIKYVPALATEELVNLLQAVGKAAPQAVRNKHKIYSILRVAHDICSYVVEAGNPPRGQKDAGIKQLLDRMEKYCIVLDALEEILLGFAEILPSEIIVFGPDMYSSWLQSRSIFAIILDKLCQPPFPTLSYKIQDIAEDSFFDDCGWLSRLVYSGIDAEVAVQFADPPMAHPVLAVTNGLHYLESQIKYGTQNERTRELVLDIATLLAQTLAATSLNHDSELRQRESSPPTAAGRDWLLQALADSFLILDLDTALEASTTQELASKWTEIKTSLTSRGMSALGK